MPEQSTSNGQQVPDSQTVTIEIPSEQTPRPSSSSGILMTHTTHANQPIQSTMRSSSELSRIFPNGVPTNLDDIRPIIAQACSNPMSLTSWLNVRLPGQQAQAPTPPSDSFVITIVDDATTATTSPTTTNNQNDTFGNNPPNNNNNQQTTATTADNFLNNIREATHSPTNSNNNNNNDQDQDDQTLESLPISPQARDILKSIQNHLPFAAIAIAKGVYDHRSGAFTLLLLLAVFIKANKDLKGEILKQQRRSRKILLNIILYIIGAFAVISITLNDLPLFIYVKSESFFDLLWCITISDFFIKLCTIIIKTLLTLLPESLLAFQKRGKYYLLIEAISQFYRATVPMYSWMSYFREAYQGAEVILGILLASFYGATKIRDILSRGKLLINSSIKFWQNVSLGSSPTKEQLGESGPICVICHEDYTTPVLLTCKHIFCENCVSTWLDRERTCPLCRAPITDDPVYRDGHTTHFIQLY